MKPIRSATLLMLACAAWTAAAAASRFDVRDYGARGDGKQLDHVAINAAIEACHAQGGGTVHLPAGVYLCGSIRLKDGINLHIDAGATILGAPSSMNAYDPPEPFPHEQYQDGGHTFFHNSLIWGEGLKNISITGRGMINGGGLTKEDNEHLGDPTGGSIGTGDKSIALKSCSNVLIRDITIFHGGHFGIIVTGCNLVTIDAVTIDTNRDGMNIDCCVNVTISNCKVNSPHDDAICIKSSYALNRPFVTENVIVTGCHVSGYAEGSLLDGTFVPTAPGWSSGRIKFGTESNGGFRNCVVTACTFRNSNGLALEQVDGGVLENIVVSNLAMRDISHYPIYITLGSRYRGPPETTGIGSADKIFISNVVVQDADSLSGIQITGLPDSPIRNVSLTGIHITYKGGGTREQGEAAFPELGSGYPEPALLGTNPAYGLYARHVAGLSLRDVTFETLQPDHRPALILEDADGVEIDWLKAPVVEGVAPFRFTNVRNVAIDHAPLLDAWKGDG